MYRVGDKIVFKVKWKNLGDRPLRVQYFEIGEGFNFVITDQAGIIVTPFVTVYYDWMISASNFPVIEPGRDFSFNVEGEVFAPGRYDHMLDPVVNAERLYGIELGGTGRVLEVRG